MSADFSQRLFVGRVTGYGDARTVAVGSSGSDLTVITGGQTLTAEPYYELDPLQAGAGGGSDDGFVWALEFETG
jgi:hypothetical protein